MTIPYDNLTWIPIDLPFGKLNGQVERDVLQPGIVVRLRQFKPDMPKGKRWSTSEGKLSDEVETLLVGDINDNNGGCGCCEGIDYRDHIVAYAWLPGFSPNKGGSDDRG